MTPSPRTRAARRLPMRLFAFVAACWFAAAAVAADPRDPATARAGGRDTATAGVTDSMAQRMQACVVCHGKEGRATRDGYYPRIAGKPATTCTTSS